MSIEVQSAKGLTLEQYDKESKARAKKSLQDYVLLYEGAAKIGNVRGREVKIGFRNNRVLVAARILYAISGGYLYLITCMTLLGQRTRYSAAFQKALDTFRVW